MQTTMQTRSAPAAGRPAQSARGARGGRVVVAAGSYHSNWRTQTTNPANGNGTSLSTYDNGRQSSSLTGRGSPLPAQPVQLPGKDNVTDRYSTVLRHFPSALGVDDFIARVEVALCYFGFTGDNSIAVTNLCRDEVTAILKDKIEAVFGGSFNTNGLGGVITCGVTGFGAGLSHAPVCADSGRERYVFFSFPHIGIDEHGEVGAISRPGRPKKSHACGAMLKVLAEVQDEGTGRTFRIPGVHDDDDPEYSILKARMVNKMKEEQINVDSRFDLVEVTKLAERTITADLERLIGKAVDPRKADYAVITGVQIHNWAVNLDNPHSYSMEFVAPSSVYCVVNGVATHLDLVQIPQCSATGGGSNALCLQVTPRMLNLLAASSVPNGSGHDFHEGFTSYSNGTSSTLQEIPSSYLFQRLISRPRTSVLTAGNGPVAGHIGGGH